MLRVNNPRACLPYHSCNTLILFMREIFITLFTRRTAITSAIRGNLPDIHEASTHGRIIKSSLSFSLSREKGAGEPRALTRDNYARCEIRLFYGTVSFVNAIKRRGNARSRIKVPVTHDDA